MSSSAQATVRVAGSVFAVAAAWILAAQLLGRLRGRRVWTTYFTELAVLAAILVPAAFGGVWFALALVLIAGACARELLAAMAPGLAAAERALLVAGAAALVALAAATGLAGAYAGFVVFACAALARLALVPPNGGPSGCELAGRSILVLLYPGLCLAHLTALGARENGFGYVVFCYGLTEINDSAAFLVGSALGRRRPWPLLSPNKTVGGCVGGALFTLAVAPAFRFALPGVGLARLLIAAALLVVFGLLGDLVASRFKRDAGIKDYAALVPTHGGVLDVYDSLVFVAPMFTGLVVLWGLP